MSMLDIFNSDAFRVTTLTDAINDIKHVPGQVSRLPIWRETPIATTSIAVEEKEGVLALVNRSARGGPGSTLTKNLKTLRSFVIPHFQIDDAIMAEEVQGVRAFGTETEVEQVQAKVAERLSVAAQSLDATEEYVRVGAIKGVITYPDTGTLNLFTEFGVAAQTEVDFDLDNASPASGALRKKCASVARTIQGELDGVPLSGLHAICSPEFFDDLIAHPEVRDTYLGYTAAAQLRDDYVYGGFPFGGIFFEEYRGAVGGTSFVEADKCYVFPISNGLFRSYYAPGDWIETVNTMGRRRYAMQDVMPNKKGVELWSQSNMLHLCTRPRALVKGKRT
jgi:hypothetical protein